MAVLQRNPFFLPLLAVLAGMALEIALPGSPESYWPAMLLLPMLGWAYFRAPAGTRHSRFPWLLAAASLFAGGFWLSLHPTATAPLANAEPGERVVAEGCVDSAVIRTPERLQFVLKTEDGARIQVGVYPREGERPPAIAYGIRVEVEGRIRPPRNFRNPGSFDYERFLARKKVFWLLSATGIENLRSGAEACGSPLLAKLHQLRNSLLKRVQIRYEAQPDAHAWLSAILLGDDSSLQEETLENYRLAGVYHVLVISGQHVAILAAAFLLLCRLLPLPRWLGFLLTALMCWGYALVAGYEVPALRAACAVTLFLAGSLVYRNSRPLNLLALIALLFLGWDPGQLLDASFQLSFLAVLAIAGIAIPLQRVLFGTWPAAARQLADTGMDLRLPAAVAEARVELRLAAQALHLGSGVPERLAQLALGLTVQLAALCGTLLLLSVVVQAVLTPLLVHDFHRAPIAAPMANLLLSPILGVVVPLAFLDLALPVPGLQQILGMSIDFTNGLVASIATFTPDLRVPDAPGILLILATAVVVAAILVWEPDARRISLRERRESVVGNASARSRFRRGLAPALAGLAAIVLALILLHPFAPAIPAGEMEVTMLDVGQGDATLLIAPNGSTVLVDTGGLGAFSSNSRLDTGEDIVAPFLWRRGIRRLDTLVLSHFDYDHAGGAPAILRIFRPRELWLSTLPESHPLWDRVKSAAQRTGAKVRFRQAGERWDSGGVSWRVLHPGWIERTGAAAAEHSNDDSLVLHVRFKATSILFTGDIHRSGELEMLSRGRLPHSDVLKVAHHGSRTSTSDAFLDAASPSLALVSAGWLNSYRHPSPDVVDRLASRGVAVFRTDREGAITLRSDGRHWRYEQTE